uniref:Cystatin domain-containing protein n=1 Tax=Anser brachyrhynchus TaxID=132585 RepID=A0A8B9BDF2_9AVES
MLCGGVSATQPATSETQKIADEVKPQLEEKEGKTFDVFTAVEFKAQLVAGTNYFIKSSHIPNVERWWNTSGLLCTSCFAKIRWFWRRYFLLLVNSPSSVILYGSKKLNSIAKWYSERGQLALIMLDWLHFKVCSIRQQDSALVKT